MSNTTREITPLATYFQLELQKILDGAYRLPATPLNLEAPYNYDRVYTVTTGGNYLLRYIVAELPTDEGLNLLKQIATESVDPTNRNIGLLTFVHQLKYLLAGYFIPTDLQFAPDESNFESLLTSYKYWRDFLLIETTKPEHPGQIHHAAQLGLFQLTFLFAHSMATLSKTQQEAAVREFQSMFTHT